SGDPRSIRRRAASESCRSWVPSFQAAPSAACPHPPPTARSRSQGLRTVSRRAIAGGTASASAEDHRQIVVVILVEVEVDDDRDVVARTLALALVALNRGALDGLGEGGRAEDEVDAQTLVAGEAQLLVVPEGESLGHERTHDIGEARLAEREERRALLRRDVRGHA